MITPAYSPTATERVLPLMALDFTTGVLDSRVTITRALNTATRINASGLIEIVNANLPRFDYNPITLAPRALLIEELRANLLSYSEQFDNASWTKTNTTVTANATTSPDGTVNADKLIENTASGTHFARTTAASTNIAYTLSAYLKAGERTRAVIAMSDLSTGDASIGINLSTGATFASSLGVGSWTNISSTVVAMANGWYRVTLTATRGGAGVSTAATIYTDNGSTINYTGDGTSGIFVWGADLEAGAFATSYIPTTLLAATRNADAVSMTGTNFSSWFNASEGALQVNATAISASQYVSAAAIYLDANNYIAFSFGDLNKPRLLIRNAGTFEVNTTASAAQTSPFNQCVAYKSGSISFASNTTLIVNSVNKPIPSGLTALYIGSNPALGATGFSNAWLTKVNYWPQRLINNEVISVSK